MGHLLQNTNGNHMLPECVQEPSFNQNFQRRQLQMFIGLNSSLDIKN